MVTYNNSSNAYSASHYQVSVLPGQGNYTTIQAAIDQATIDGADGTNPAVVWIQAGNYTEDLTLSPYVSLQGAGSPGAVSVLITGNAAFASSGLIGFNNLMFASNSASAAISFQGPGATNIYFHSVFIDGFEGKGLECTGANMVIQYQNGSIQATSTGVCLNISAGTVDLFSVVCVNTGVASTLSGGITNILSCNNQDAYVMTGTAQLNILNSAINSGSLSCIDIGGTAVAASVNSFMGSSAASGFFVTGTGTFYYNGIENLYSAGAIDQAVTFIGIPNITGNLSFDGGTTVMDTDGQFWIGSTGSYPVPATLTPGTGIGIVNAAGSVTINSTGGGITWNIVGASDALVSNNGYICTSGAALSFSLPVTSSVGDVITLALDGATSWTLTQPNVGNQIRIESSETTLGVGGSLSSNAQGNTVTLICETANARWVVVASMGSITIV
jgi:hypothetical protein